MKRLFACPEDSSFQNSFERIIIKIKAEEESKRLKYDQVFFSFHFFFFETKNKIEINEKAFCLS